MRTKFYLDGHLIKESNKQKLLTNKLYSIIKILNKKYIIVSIQYIKNNESESTQKILLSDIK